jgi:glycosyltransferase involved in cell wall biosynthesis
LASPSPTAGRRFKRALVLITEDRFVLSHFKPLVAVLREVADDVAVVTHCDGRRGEIEALGVRVVEFDFGRWSNNPVREAFAALRLARLLRAEKPDVVHLVAMKPIVLGCFALQFGGPQHAVVHMTGLGQLGFATEGLVRLFRGLSLRPIARVLKKPSTYLLVENPDDLEYLQGAGIEFGRRHAVVPGAGIDPQEFPALDPPRNEVPVAAFVGRMIKPKGIDVLMRAFEQLRRNSVRIELELFGATDPDDPEAITPEALKAWCAQYGARWDGYASDIREAWRRADMFVLPARTREGMPRAMLEAAACARPLIVSDVSGCRHFVSDGVEGLVVAPEDVTVLAEAMRRLAADPALRERMGTAARRKLLGGFTESHVRDRLRGAYRYLLQA